MGFYARWVLPSAGALLALATIAGALGAHSLHLSAGRLAIYDTAVRYQFYQSLGLLLAGMQLRGLHPDNLTAAKRQAAQRFVSAPRALLAGIVLFSGSLYALSLGAPRWVGIVTPVGGALLILGWVFFVIYVRRL
jgi:uncharacterized membrane protein YgdD (TMEM256/DUF423 family)